MKGQINMSCNNGSRGNFCCRKTVMALCITGLSECFSMSSVTSSHRILHLNFSRRFSSITQTCRFMFVYFLYNPPILKKQNLCVSRLLTLPVDVILGSLIEYQLLCNKSTFNVSRIERNFLLSPMSTALLIHGS